MKSSRMVELDSVRGLAALAVVIYHYFYRYNDIFGHNDIGVDWVSMGKHGVEVFFLVSGFVIYWSLYNVKNPFDFVVSRFSRLYPVYWVSVILTFTLVTVVGLDGRDVSFNEALINLTMLQGFLQVPSVDGVYWTLMIELIFYFWMFILLIFKLHDNAEVFLSVFIIINLLDILLPLNINGPLSKLMLFDYMTFFVSGICFYKIINDLNRKRSVFILCFCLFSTLLTYSAFHFLIFLSVYALFYLSLIGRIGLMRSKYLVFLGGVSYSLYLVHQNIGYLIINLFYERGLGGLFGIFCAFIISLLLAYILTKYVEKPGLIFIRKKYKAMTS